MRDGLHERVVPAKHNIGLNDPGKAPIPQNLYRAGRRRRELEKMENDKMLFKEAIDLASKAWSSTIVFPPNNDGPLRFCVDYRKVNAVAVCDS